MTLSPLGMGGSILWDRYSDTHKLKIVMLLLLLLVLHLLAMFLFNCTDLFSFVINVFLIAGMSHVISEIKYR